MRALNILLILIVGLASVASFQAKAGNRDDSFLGFDVSFGQPFPSIIGGTMSFNIEDDARFSFGTGYFGNWVTYGAGLKLFLSPEDEAMFIGAGLNYMRGNAGTFFGWNLQFNKAFVPYIEAGYDYTADSGFHLGASVAVGIPNGEFVILPFVILPILAVGWYF
jgi:hypothetical protein